MAPEVSNESAKLSRKLKFKTEFKSSLQSTSIRKSAFSRTKSHRLSSQYVITKTKIDLIQVLKSFAWPVTGMNSRTAISNKSRLSDDSRKIAAFIF